MLKFQSFNGRRGGGRRGVLPSINSMLIKCWNFNHWICSTIQCWFYVDIPPVFNFNQKSTFMTKIQRWINIFCYLGGSLVRWSTNFILFFLETGFCVLQMKEERYCTACYQKKSASLSVWGCISAYCLWCGQFTGLERHQCLRVDQGFSTTYALIQTMSLSGKALQGLQQVQTNKVLLTFIKYGFMRVANHCIVFIYIFHRIFFFIWFVKRRHMVCSVLNNNAISK